MPWAEPLYLCLTPQRQSAAGLTHHQGRRCLQTCRVTVEPFPSPSDPLSMITQPADPLLRACTCVCPSRLQKTSASNPAVFHLTPGILLKQLIKLQEGPFSGLGLQGSAGSLVSSRGGPCSALPPACPPASWTLALSFQSADPVLTADKPHSLSCFFPLGSSRLPTLLTTCPSPQLPVPPSSAIPRQFQGHALWEVLQDKREGMDSEE